MVDQKWVKMGITSAMALATTFALLAVFTTWAFDGDPETGATGYKPGEVTAVRDGDVGSASLGNQAFDDVDGAGLARAGSVMLVIGLCFIIASFVAFEHELLTGKSWITVVGVSSGALGALMWLIALILFPIGVAGLAEARTGGFIEPDLTWGAGLAFGIIASVFSLAGTITAGIRLAMDSGFRLELADSTGTANFD